MRRKLLRNMESRMCARELKSDAWPDVYAGIPSLEAVKARISIAANHKKRFKHAHRCVTCVLPREGPETSADATTSGGQNGHRRWESGIDEEEHVRNDGRGQQLERDWQGHVRNWGFQLGLSSKNLFHH